MQSQSRFPLAFLAASLISSSPALAADASSTRLLSVRGDDPQLSVRTKTSNQQGSVDNNIGLRLDLPPDEMGKTRLEFETTSQDGGAPQFDSLVLDQRLAVPKIDLLPGKLDLGVRASRQRDVAAWDLAVKPKFKMERGDLAFTADMSVGRLANGDVADLGARYKLNTSYALNHSLSVGVGGQGEVRRNGVRPQAGLDQMTPQVTGRYFITDGLALRYRMGWDMNLNSGERSPDVEVKFDLRF
jgi:hypothetical protein